MDFSYVTSDSSEQWNEWRGHNFEVRNGGVALATEPRTTYTDLEFDAIDVSVDRDGTIYALRPSGDVVKYREQEEFAQRVWHNEGEGAIAEPTAICVTGDRVYVADGDTGDLVVVSDRSGEAVGRVEAALDDPVAIVRGDRKIYVLDRGTGVADGRVLNLIRRGNVRTLIRGLDSPADMAVDDSGNVHLIEQEDGSAVISTYDASSVESPNAFPYKETVTGFEVDESGEVLVPQCIEALNETELLLSGIIASSGEPATFHYRLDRAGTDAFERRYGFDLYCSRFVLAPQRNGGRYPTYYAVAGEDDRVYAIEESKEYRKNPRGSLYDARAFRRLDSGSPGTQWHRVTVDYESLASNTQVIVSYYASNHDRQTAEGIELVEGVTEKDAEDLRAAGIEGVWDLIDRDPAEIADAAEFASEDRVGEWVEEALTIVDEEWEGRWKTLRAPNPGDALLDEAEGRYLHLRLRLIGDSETSPEIDQFRAYCPRQSYLRYMPEIFRDGRRGASFLEEFMSVFESAFVDLEEDVDALTEFFDPHGVPSEYLPWLGGWLAIEFDEEWPEPAKRELLARAPDLFKKRGTREGMGEILELYLGHVEAPDTSWMTGWQKSRIEQRAADGMLTEREKEAELAAIDHLSAGHSDGHLLFFLEHLDLDRIDDEAAKRPYTQHMHGERSFLAFAGPFVQRDHHDAVRRIVAKEKPAHADGSVIEIRQQCKLEGNCFLGINSALVPREFVLGRSTLGGDTVLKERESF